MERSLFEYLFDLQLYETGECHLTGHYAQRARGHSRKKLVIVAIDPTLVTS